MTQEVTRAVTGRVHVHPRGFGFVSVTESDGAVTSGFVAPPALNPFLAGDEVSAAFVTAEDGRISAQDLRLVKRTRTRLFGEVVVRKGTPYLKVDREVANTDWPLETRGVTVTPGAHAVGRVERDGLVLEKIVPAATDASLERVIARHNLHDEVPAPALEDVRKARTVAHDVGHRRDLREIPTVTVDAPSTRDIDDAIAVLPADADGAMRLLVSIADASEGIAEGSALDLDARDRATSVYLAGRVLPMIPDGLSAEWLSLLPGQDRRCLTVEMRIDPEGRVTAADVYESVIRSSARLNYTEVNAWLEHAEVSPAMEPVRASLPWLRTAFARLGVARARRGGVVIERDEAKIILDAKTGEPESVETVHSNAAHLLIERFMVAANEAIAVWMHDRGLPALYRVHDVPAPADVHDLEAFAHNFGFEAALGGRLTPLALTAFDAQISGMPSEPALRSVLRRTLGIARYTVHASPHFGLAAPLYLHFTSPIRRYADLAVHRVIKRYLHGQRDFDPRDPGIEALGQHVNERASTAARAETDRHRMLTARLMTDRIGEKFSARITRIRPFGLLAQIDTTQIEGVVPIESLPRGPYRPDARETSLESKTGRYTIGMPLDVRIAATDPSMGRIEFALVDR